MVADPPLSRLTLVARSVADDLGFVALADLSTLLRAEEPDSYRIIGGHMMTALVARWRLGPELYRQTGDTDLGIPPIVVHRGLIERLTEAGYGQVAGDRFARDITDIPVRLAGQPAGSHQAFIDVLVPSHTSRARQNRKIGNLLVATEARGLLTALNRPSVVMALTFHRLNGETREADLSFPDEVAAIVLKSLVTQVRDKATDFVDLWRCLEIALVAGVSPGEFAEGEQAESAAIVRTAFGMRGGRGMSALISEHRLSDEAADERFTRLRALITRVLGTG
jgi:hypothetical protein